MFGRSDLVQNLKLDILDLKKELASSKEDNQLLKVKIRKLQNEVGKRDRQIETLLDPRNSAFVRRVISDRGASVLINLRERNLKLEKILAEKDLLIKRLQNDIQMTKLYTVKTGDKKKSFSRQIESSKHDINNPYCEQNCVSDSEKEDDNTSLEHGLKSISMHDISRSMERLCFRSRSARSTSMQRAVSADRTQSNKLSKHYTSNDTNAQYDGLSRDHLLSIIESLKNNQRRLSPCMGKRGSPESDLERNELLCDTPHLEIQQLQNYFMDMLGEVDQLKTTITGLKSDQDKTVHLLKQKDNNIIKLAKEIKNLKRPKSEIKNSLHVKPLGTNSSRLCMYKKRTLSSVKNAEKTQNRTKTMVEAENQAEEAVAEKETNVCTYIEAEELKPQEKEDTLQIIQTRTISIQKFDHSSNYDCNQTTSVDSEIHSERELQSSKVEEEARREKFNNLLEQMLHKTCSTVHSDYEDGNLETEYI